jgi:CxxC motif-containing protein
MKDVKMSCTTCPNSCEMVATVDGGKMVAVVGNLCKRGIDFAEQEWINPMRTLTSTMILRRAGREAVSVPVRSAAPMPRNRMMAAMAAIRKTAIDHPVAIGEVLIPDVAGCGIDIVASKTVE